MTTPRAQIRLGVEGADQSRRELESVRNALRGMNETSLGGLSRQVNALDRGFSALRSTVGGALAGIAGGLSFGAITQQLVSAQTQFDRLNASLITATGSAKGAAVAYKSLQAFAATTPYSVSEATEAFIKMKNLGLDPSEKSLRSYGNTAAAMGKSLEQMVEAVADASTGEFERLKEFGIKASQNGEKVALTFRGVTTNIGNNANEIQAYLRKIGEVEFGGAMEQRAKTLDGAISNLGDSWESLKLSFAQSGFGDAAQLSVRKLAGSLDAIGNSVGAVSDGLVTAAKVGAAYFAIVQAAPILYTAAASALSKLAAATATYAMNVAIGQANTIGLNTVLFGTSVSAQLAAGSLTKVGLAANVLFAAFAGWQIGTYLEEQSTKVKVFAEVLTGSMLEIWEHIKLGAKLGLDAITVLWRTTFSGLTASLATMYGGIAAGLNKIGFEEKGAQVQEFADRVRAAGESQGTFASRTAEARAEHERNIKAIRQVTDSHVAAIIVADQVSEATRGIAVAATAASAAKKEMSKEEKKALEAAKEFIEGQKKELEAIGKTEAQQRMLNAARAAAAAPTKEQKKQIIELAEEINRQSEMWKLAENAREAAAKADADHYAALRSGTAAIDDRIKQMQGEIDLYGLSASAAVDAERAKLEAKLAAGPATYAELVALDAQIDKLGQLAKLTRNKEALDANKKAAEQAAEDWKRSAEQVGQSLIDNIMRGGKSAAEYLKDLFRTLVLRPIIQPIGSAVGNFVNGAMGMPAGTQAGGGASSSLASSVSNLYNAFKSGGSFENSVANGVQAGLDKLGLSQGAGTTGAFAQGAGVAAGYLAGGAAGIYGGRAISNGYAVSGSGNGLVNAGTAVGAIVGGPIGAAIGGMIAGAVNRAFGTRPKEVTRTSIDGTFGAGGFVGNISDTWKQDGGWLRSDKDGVTQRAADAELVTALNAGYTALKTSTADYIKTLGINADWLMSRSQNLSVALTGDAAKDQQAIADFFAKIGNDIAVEFVPSLTAFQKVGEAASATLQRLATDYAMIDTALTSIGMAFGSVGVASLDARERLIEAAGGLEAFAANTAGFQQNFLTEAERNAPVLKMVTEQLAAMGLSSVDTRDEFKSVVLGLDLTTEAGAKQYGALMKLQAAFAQVYPEIESTADAAKAAADALAQTNKGYQDQINEILRGRMAPADQRAFDTKDMDASTVALYDRLAALKSETAALDAAAERSREVAAEAKSLQDQYDELTMTTAQLAEKARSAIDPANRARYDEIQAIKTTREWIEKASQTSAEAERQRQAAVAQVMDAANAANRGWIDSMVSGIDRAKEAARAFRELNESLKIGDLSPLSREAQYGLARNQLLSASPENLSSAASAFLKASKDREEGSLAYARDFAMVQEMIEARAAGKDQDARTLERVALYFRDQLFGMDGSHANGLDYVPFDGYRAVLHQGERVQTAAEARSNDAAVVEAVNGMRRELNDALYAIAKHTMNTADRLDEAINGDKPLATKVVPA